MIKKLDQCRICGNRQLELVLDLGDQALTGVFPKDKNTPVTRGPLQLLKCVGNASTTCGLLQLAHSYDLEEMYGANYGYRSGLNASMVAHLRSKVERIERYGILNADSIVVDIGANDGTTLGLYTVPVARRIGIDPTSAKFLQYYKDGIEAVPQFFSAAAYRAVAGERNASVVTSFSMFYDMEDPMGFMREIAEILDNSGIWVCEQSYMPLMLETTSYDTACHEHLEYYALAQIFWMAERTGLDIVDVELNDVNGGSFSFVAQKVGGPLIRSSAVAELAAREAALNLNDLAIYRAFADRTKHHRRELLDFIASAKRDNKRVAALGASTKGNVLLQYCGLGPNDVEAIGEVNADKFGAYAPGSLIPIVDETELLATNPDYLIVLPWHFRAFFENQPRYAGLKLVYPLPVLEY